MIEQLHIEHHIQKHIVSVLMFTRVARFRDLRPLKTDTNLFTYHLKLLVKNHFIIKTEGGYTLGQKGLAYIDRVSTEKFTIRNQPNIITMLVVQNSEGDVLLQKRNKQPYIDTWTLPYGKVDIDDKSITESGQREALEKLALSDQTMRHAGNAYIRVTTNEGIISTTLAHVMFFETDDVKINDLLAWARPHKISQYELAPCVEQIMTRTFFKDEHFFEEFTESW